MKRFPHRCRGREAGVAYFTTMLGALIMLLTLLSATHVIVNLQRRSVIHAVAVDAVTNAARDGGSQRDQDARLRRFLGTSADWNWSNGGPHLVLNVRASGVRIIGVGPLRDLSKITIEVRARREELS